MWTRQKCEHNCQSHDLLRGDKRVEIRETLVILKRN